MADSVMTEQLDTGATLVCRCEEIRSEEIAAALAGRSRNGERRQTAHASRHGCVPGHLLCPGSYRNGFTSHRHAHRWGRSNDVATAGAADTPGVARLADGIRVVK